MYFVLLASQGCAANFFEKKLIFFVFCLRILKQSIKFALESLTNK